ncbi:MAG: hypothetical protein HY247_04410 [archaeon]|nr:MAG: hypothetical protein HY247_04410 [archaeon]
MKTTEEKKGIYLASAVIAFSFLVTGPNLLVSKQSPGIGVTDTSTGVNFSVIQISKVISLSGAGGAPTFPDFWFYLSNPSKNVTRTSVSCIDLFGVSRTCVEPLHQVYVNELDIQIAAPNGTTFTSDSFTPPTGATSPGSFPTPGALDGTPTTLFGYRWDFRGWGQASVAPAENALVFFVGYGVGAPTGTYTVTATMHYTIAGTPHSVSLTFTFKVVA